MNTCAVFGHGQEVVEKYIKAKKNFDCERAAKDSFIPRKYCAGYM